MQENNIPMMVLTGKSGDGKTMLLAEFVLTVQVNF